jgi:hypothetical protein
VQPVTNNTLCMNNSQSNTGAVLQATGGTPPYYFIALDDADGVVVSAPEVRLDKGAAGGRVLVADQGGSQQMIYVLPASSPLCHTQTPTANKPVQQHTATRHHPVRQVGRKSS